MELLNISKRNDCDEEVFVYKSDTGNLHLVSTTNGKYIDVDPSTGEETKLKPNLKALDMEDSYLDILNKNKLTIIIKKYKKIQKC